MSALTAVSLPTQEATRVLSKVVAFNSVLIAAEILFELNISCGFTALVPSYTGRRYAHSYE